MHADRWFTEDLRKMRVFGKKDDERFSEFVLKPFQVSISLHRYELDRRTLLRIET